MERRASRTDGYPGLQCRLPGLFWFRTATAEIFPTHMRATANAVANNVLGRLGCVLSPSLIGLLSSPLESVGNAATVVVWGNVLIRVPILLLLLPETRGKTLEEIATRTPATGGNNKDRRDE